MTVQDARKPIRVLIADDHPVLREGLTRLLQTQSDMTVVGEAGNGKEAIEKVRALHPDVLLLDWSMPMASGLDALRSLSKMRGFTVKPIVLTADIEQSDAVEALKTGARGIVLKDSATQLLLKAIRTVVAGEYWIGRDQTPLLVDALRAPVNEVSRAANTFGLTPRELQIISAIVNGSTNKVIASDFGISEQTVKNHLTAIFDKTGVSNRLELVLFASKNKLTDERR